MSERLEDVRSFQEDHITKLQDRLISFRIVLGLPCQHPVAVSEMRWQKMCQKREAAGGGMLVVINPIAATALR
jgi:hypothetical protein